MAARSSGLSISRASPLARASPSPGGKIRPFSPWRIRLGLPPQPLARAGRPMLIPSRRERLEVSLTVEALTCTSIAHRARSTSWTKPASTTHPGGRAADRRRTSSK